MVRSVDISRSIWSESVIVAVEKRPLEIAGTEKSRIGSKKIMRIEKIFFKVPRRKVPKMQPTDYQNAGGLLTPQERDFNGYKTWRSDSKVKRTNGLMDRRQRHVCCAV